MKRKTINLPQPVLQSSKTFNVNLRTNTDSVTNGADKMVFVWRQNWTTAQFVTGLVFMRRF